MKAIRHIAFGGGLNSWAMLFLAHEQGASVDLITYADTGAEMPHTLAGIESANAVALGFFGVGITIVRKLYQGRPEGLVGQCERQSNMPSIAYGLRSCSMKYKHEPQERALVVRMRELGATTAERWIGFDAGEAHRVKAHHLDAKPLRKRGGLQVINKYPLVDAGMRREDCAAIIKKYGFPIPRKSSCYVCAAMKKSEVFRLRDEYPELLAKALQIEANAQKTNTTKRGLGGERNLWADWLYNDAAQCKLGIDIEPMHTPCGCYDGGEA